MGNIIYITKGHKLRYKESFIVISNDEGDFKISPDDIDSIIIESKLCSLTIDTHLACARNNIPIIICNEKYQPEVFAFNLYSYHRLTKRLQEQVNWDESKKIEVARKIIGKKLKHQYDLIKYLKLENEKEKYYIDYIEKVNLAKNIEEINSYEAIVARVYFQQLFGNNFKRMEEDVMNAALNYGYMIIRAKIMSVILAKGYNPSLAFFHRSQFNNFNLADDLIEIYRPLVDFLVYLKIKDKKSFDKESRLTIQNVLLEELTYKGQTVTLKRSIEKFLDEITYYMSGDIEEIELPELEVERYGFEI